MHTLIATAFRTRFQLGLFVLAFPLLAHAGLPQSSNVPGGVAIIPLGSVAAVSDVPQTWFGDQPVLVTSDQNQWVAVVGLALSVTPGPHALRQTASRVASAFPSIWAIALR